MAPNPLKNSRSIDHTNFRAEDGLQPNSNLDTFYENVIIPLGSVFAILMAILGIHLMNR
jgi:hypothetical protein